MSAAAQPQRRRRMDMHLCWQPAPHAASEVAAVAVSRSRRCTSHEHSRCPVKAPKPKLVAPRTPGYSPVRNEASEDMGRADQGLRWLPCEACVAAWPCPWAASSC